MSIKGTEKIAEGLRGPSALVRLNLAWNGLGDRGAEHIGSAIRENQILQFLDVSSNRIGFDGSRAVADGLRENQTLRSLQLNGNPIGDKGVVVIIEAVGEQCSVRDLGLQDCSTFTSGDGIFDPRNPTGHYKLELSDAFELERFEKLRELDKMDEASGMDNFINLKLDGVEVAFAEGQDILSWKPPLQGALHFDYVATKRVPKEAKAQRHEVFQSFRKELSNPALSEETKLLMLRSAATTHYWSAAQVRELIVLITFQRRVDAVVVLFRRTVDLDQFYAEVWTLLKHSEQLSVRRRLGESLARLLKEHEPTPDDTAVVFMTEVAGPPAATDVEGGDEEGGAEGGGVNEASVVGQLHGEADTPAGGEQEGEAEGDFVQPPLA